MTHRILSLMIFVVFISVWGPVAFAEIPASSCNGKFSCKALKLSVGENSCNGGLCL